MTSFSSYDNVNRIPEKGKIKNWGRNCRFFMNVLKWAYQQKTDIMLSANWWIHFPPQSLPLLFLSSELVIL